MLSMEPNTVLKYFEPADAFIQVRRYSNEEIAKLLREAQLTDRRSYVGLVLHACIPSPTPQMMEHEEDLYELSVEVNPGLDIREISVATEADAPPIHLLEGRPRRSDFRRLGDMEETLSRRVVGQDRAISSVSRAVKKAMTGIRNPDRPIATFFFVGQTGVGKTELAKALTVYLFQDAGRMTRVDGSEFALPHEYAKLLGAPPGYVGHGDEGVLARDSGPRTILFDEIEKSDRRVHDLLLQAMDEGFVTDARGRRLPFGETILILTSNVGAEEAEALRHRIGFRRSPPDSAEMREEFRRAIKANFRPEFVNRITEVVFFNPIGMDECERIAGIMLEEARRHAANVPLSLRYSRAVPRFLAELSWRPECGAREVRRTVETEVEGRLSEMLVDGSLSEGDRVSIRVDRDHLSFNRN